MAKERFIETYSQGISNVRKIIVDTETGLFAAFVQYDKRVRCGCSS